MTFRRHLLDSNILIDYLLGIQAAADLIESLPGPILISIITRMEVLAGARNTTEEEEIIAFLDGFETVQLEHDIIIEATRVRRHGAALGKKPRLPDAIIYATAMERGAILYTRNSKDFPACETTVHPYTVETVNGQVVVTVPQAPSATGRALMDAVAAAAGELNDLATNVQMAAAVHESLKKSDGDPAT